MSTDTIPTAKREPPKWLRSVLSQFKKPEGILGRVAGWIMATRPSNVYRNLWTVELLDIQPGDRVLEIGFGPGVAVEATTSRTTDGHILGIDHSPLMVRQATSRNRQAVDAGRAELRLGTLEDLRPEDKPFDKMLSVNCAQFWHDREGTLRTLFEALVPGGTLGITYQPRHPGATESDALAFAEQATELAKAVGFTRTRTEKLDLEPVCAVCILLTK